MDRTAIQQLGKIELHCHLDGSLSLPTIRQLAQMANVPIPESDEALRALVQAPKETTSLSDYLKTFDFIAPLLQTAEALELAAYDVVAQAAAENVRYIEVRFAPALSLAKGLDESAATAAVIAGLQRAMATFDIVANALVCGMRHLDNETNATMFTAVADQLGQGLGGGDFAGNEADFPTTSCEPAIQAAQHMGMPLTFHAGECHCPQNIAYAIRLGIHRIGHGTACFDQPQLIEEIVTTQTTIELCLTSNLQTKAARSIAEFPYLPLKAAGARITINTDNRTVSNTTLTQEYLAFQHHFHTTAQDFYTFNQNALDAAFVSPQDRKQLQERLHADYASVLTLNE